MSGALGSADTAVQKSVTHFVLELNPARERTRRRVVVFHVFCRSPLSSGRSLIFFCLCSLRCFSSHLLRM